MKFWILYFFIFPFFVIYHCKNHSSTIHPKAVQGVLDLRSVRDTSSVNPEKVSREWNFETDGTVRLDGDWEFYWEQFLIPSEKSALPAYDYIPVPHSWNGHSVKSPDGSQKIIEGLGYATYRMKVLLPENSAGEILALSSKYQGTAYRIFANSKLIQSAGKVSSDMESAEALHLPTLGYIPVQGKELDIVIHISNYHNRLGGVWNSLYLGKVSHISAMVSERRETDFFSVGIIFIMSLYHFLIWYIRKKTVSPLLFAVLCLIVLIRLLTTSEYLLIEWMPYLGYKVFSFIEYCSMYFCVPVGIHYFSRIFPNRFNRPVLTVTYPLSILFAVFALFTPVRIFSRTAEIYQIVLLAGVIYLAWLLVNSVRNKLEYSVFSLSGFLILSMTMVNDIMYARELISTGFYAPFGLLALIFSQAVILSLRFSKAFTQVEELTGTLEQKVEERTSELNQSKKEIEALNNFSKIVNSFSDLNQIFVEISKYVYKRYNIAAVWLFLPDEKEAFLHTFKVYSHNKMPEGAYQYMKSLQIPLNEEGGNSYSVWKRKKPFYLRRIPELKSEIDRAFVEKAGSISLLQVPLLMKQRTVGLMAFSNIGSPMYLNKPDIQNISGFCAQIAGVVNTANLLQQTARQKKETEEQKKYIEELSILVKSLNENLDIQIIMKKLHEYLKQHFGIQHYGLSGVNSDRTKINTVDCSLPDSVSAEDREKVLKMQSSIDTGAHSIAFRSKKVLYSKIRKSVLNAEELFLVEMIKAENIMILPLILQNEPIGFLELFNSGRLSLRKDDIIQLSILGEQLAGIICSSNLFKQVQEEKKKAETEKGIAVAAQCEAEQERKKSDKLLLNILPEKVAEELKEKGITEPVVYESATVLFTDFKGFTNIAEKMHPHLLIKELDECFSQFDRIIEKYGLEKLKTIGDSYMCAGGLPRVNETHAVDSCLAALEILLFMNALIDAKKVRELPYWELRIGIHSGSVIAGVIGEKKFAYDVWGDTVNTASRMESSGTSGKINISFSTYTLVQEFFECEYRGEVDAKNKGQVKMYYLRRLKSKYSKDENGFIPNEIFLDQVSAGKLTQMEGREVQKNLP